MFRTGLGLGQHRASYALLQTKNEGYRLALEAARFDLREYRRHEMIGNRHMRSGNPCAAISSFREAAALWQGPPLADVNHGRFLKAEIATLEGSHLKMLESLFGAQLLVGRHRDVLSDLASLVVQHPFNEGLHAQFMLALHRSGHRARALEVFARLRSTLSADLGIAPTPYLRDLHQAVLDADSSLNSTVVMPGA